MALTNATSPDLYREERYRVGKFTCDICGSVWPMTHQRLTRGGLHVGVVCCWEPMGDETERDIRSAMSAKKAAAISAVELQPPKSPTGDPYAGAPEYIDNQPAITGYSPEPVVLQHGGAAVAVVVSGVNFASTDSFTYGNSGITNNSAPVNVSVTEWDLSVKASAGTPAGLYSLTFTGVGGDSQLWTAFFDVR